MLRARGAHALVTGEPITWSLAGTCPAPVATMIGEGRLAGLFVVMGLVAGVGMQRSLARRRSVTVGPTVTQPAVGL